MGDSLESALEEPGITEKLIQRDAFELATSELGVDDRDVINGFQWVGYSGNTQHLRVLVFPEPIDARGFFDRVDGSIRSLLKNRPIAGVRSGPSIQGHARPKRSDAAYLSVEALESIVRSSEEASLHPRTGVSRVFVRPPEKGDLMSYSFTTDQIDSYRPGPWSGRRVPSVKRFLAVDRFGTEPPGDVDIILQPDVAARLVDSGERLTDHRGDPLEIRLSSTGTRVYVLDILREGVVREYRLLAVGNRRTGPKWYVDAHDVLSAIKAYARR